MEPHTELPLSSRCCSVPIYLVEGDGRHFGVCSKCRGFEVQVHPVTYRLEWLDTNISPWSQTQGTRPSAGFIIELPS